MKHNKVAQYLQKRKEFRDLKIVFKSHPEVISLIKNGYRKNLNVSIYAKPEFRYEQMTCLKKGLEQGIYVEDIAAVTLNDPENPRYLPSEMYRLIKARSKGQDISGILLHKHEGLRLYHVLEKLNEGISADKFAYYLKADTYDRMILLDEMDRLHMDLSKAYQYESFDVSLLVDARIRDVPIEPIIESGITGDPLQFYLQKMDEGYPNKVLTYFANPNLSIWQLFEMDHAYQSEVPLDLLKPDYPEYHMEKIVNAYLNHEDLDCLVSLKWPEFMAERKKRLVKKRIQKSFFHSNEKIKPLNSAKRSFGQTKVLRIQAMQAEL